MFEYCFALLFYICGCFLGRNVKLVCVVKPQTSCSLKVGGRNAYTETMSHYSVVEDDPRIKVLDAEQVLTNAKSAYDELVSIAEESIDLWTATNFAHQKELTNKKIADYNEALQVMLSYRNSFIMIENLLKKGLTNNRRTSTRHTKGLLGKMVNLGAPRQLAVAVASIVEPKKGDDRFKKFASSQYSIGVHEEKKRRFHAPTCAEST